MDLHLDINFKFSQLDELSYEKIKYLHKACFQKTSYSDSSYNEFLCSSLFKTYGIFNKKESLCAFITLTINLDECDIVSICTNKNYRRIGLASYLINYSALINGVRYIYLEVAIDNNLAINFYKRNNFEVVGIRKQYTVNSNGEKVDSYVMRKKCFT